MIKNKLKVILEDLAMPEIHVVPEDEQKVAEKPAKAAPAEEKKAVTYDTLAVPEIHIKH